MIYLDYAANTPIEKEVLDTYYQATMHYFANPNANHSLGLQAKDIIDQITKKFLNNYMFYLKKLFIHQGPVKQIILLSKGF